MTKLYSKRALYVALVVFLMFTSVAAAVWATPPSVVQGQAPLPTTTPAPPAPPAPPPAPLPATVGIIVPKSPDGEVAMKMGYEWAKQNGLSVIAERWYPPGDFATIERMVVELALGIKPGHIYIGDGSEKDSSFIQEVLKKVGYAGKVILGGLRPPQTAHVSMGWREKGPVFNPGQGPPMATVVQIHPNLFAMWYQANQGINWATSPDGGSWSDQGPIAVTGAIPEGYTLARPTVVFWREQVGAIWQEHFLMYASAVKVIDSVRHYDYVLVLESTDGANWSVLGTAFADDTPGVDPAGSLGGLTAIKDGSGYQGWLARDNAVWHTTSADGVAWGEPQATTGLPGSLVRPTVVSLAGKYVAWYSYALNAADIPYTAIGMALSDDGIAWTPNPENPLFKVEANTWRSELVLAPWVALDEANGLWRMWSSGRTSHVKDTTEFLTLDPASPTDSPAPGRFARGVADPSSIVMQLRFTSAGQPVEAVNGINDDDGNLYAVGSFEPAGKVTVAGWDTLDGGKAAVNETLKVYYKQRVRDNNLGYSQAPTHILHDVVRNASWGDEVVVHPGVYLGQVYSDKAIRLRSSHGPTVTIVDARQEKRYVTDWGSYPAVWFKVEEKSWSTMPDWWLKQFGVPETRVEGFTISNAVNQGVRLSLLPGDKAKLNPRGRVVNNVARGNSGTGIFVVSSSGDMRLENNLAYGNGAPGIRVSASAWTGLFNNSVHDNEQEGLRLEAREGGWSYSHVQGNQVLDNGGDGIYSTMNAGQFVSNQVTGNAGAGIRLETQARPLVRDNTVAGNTGDGVSVRQAHIESNQVQNNGGSGVRIENEAWVGSNTISANGGDGVKVEPGAANVLDNTIQDNGGHGVALVGSDKSRVVDNTISGNGGDGVHATTSGNLISSNQITANQQHGIWLDGDDNRVVANTIQDNLSAGSGIGLTASAEGNQVHYNNIAGNTTYGVLKEGTPAVDAINNWWGDASGPSGSGPGTGDAVNENVLYAPWLAAPFSDTTPPVIDEALALPRSIAIYGALFDEELGPTVAQLLVRASDEHVGVAKAEVNLRPLAEMLTSDLQIPAELQSDWDEALQWAEHLGMRNEAGVWRSELSLEEVVGELTWWLLEGGVFEMPTKLHAGDAQVPVTVYDGAGNQATATIDVSVVDYMTPLNVGWNLRSLPVALDDDAWGSIKSVGGGLDVDVALRYDQTARDWQVVEDTDRWLPLDAIYIHATERDQLNLIVGRSPTAPPLRDLEPGWALVGPAPALGLLGDEMEMPVTQALRSLEVNAAGERGYLVATSPAQLAVYFQEYRYYLPDGSWRDYGSYVWGFMQDPWAYLSGDAWANQNMIAGGGYWVYMEHADSLVGFSSTPLVTGVEPEASDLVPAQAPSSGPPALPLVLKVSAPGNWSQIEARIAGQVVGQASSPGDTLLVQGDITKGTAVGFYVDGVVADQTVAYESGTVVDLPLTVGARAADVNADSAVDIADLVAVALRFNTPAAAGDPADINGDGVVNIFDLARAARYFGTSLQ